MPHFYIMDKSNHLAHYGHKGQQWGVRNYQNYDGTYTQAGLERYWPNRKHRERGSATKERGGVFDKIFKTKNDARRDAAIQAEKERRAKMKPISKTTPQHDGPTEAMRAIANGAKGYDSKIDQIRALTADCDSLTLHGVWDKPTPREREACNLGLDALNALGQLDWYDEDDPDDVRKDKNGWDNDAINWFNFEDQTVGYSLAADLINQGYTAAQVKSLRDQVDSINWTMSRDSDDSKALHDDDDLTNVVLELIMLDNDDYIDKCYELKHRSAKRGGKTRGGMMTDMAEGISSGVVGLGERMTDALRRTGERITDKASAADEKMRVNMEVNSLIRGPYDSSSSLARSRADAWTGIPRSDVNRMSVAAQMNQDIANGMSIGDARKKYFDPMVKASLADRNLTGNKEAERRIRDAWSSTTSSYGYRTNASAVAVREQRKLEQERQRLEKMRSKVYDENYNIIDPALYRKYQAAKKDYKASKKVMRSRIDEEILGDYRKNNPDRNG